MIDHIQAHLQAAECVLQLVRRAIPDVRQPKNNMLEEMLARGRKVEISREICEVAKE